jgi:hypothetical protein
MTKVFGRIIIPVDGGHLSISGTAFFALMLGRV